jgi:hypothetical protein
MKKHTFTLFVLLGSMLFMCRSSEAQSVISPYTISTFVSGLSNPVTAFAIDQSTGNIYYAGQSVDGTLYEITPTGGITTVATDWAGVDNYYFGFDCTGIAFYSGNIFSFVQNNSTLDGAIIEVNSSGVSTIKATATNKANEGGAAIAGNIMYTSEGTQGANLYTYNLRRCK